MIPLPEAPPPVVATVSVGYDVGYNDPFALRHGPRLSAGFTAFEQLDVQFGATWFPLAEGEGCDNADWTPRACGLLSQAAVAPDISRISARGGASVAWLPLRTSGAWSTGAGLSVAAGAVYTVDDLVAAQAVGEPSAEATAEEWHPYYGGGLVTDLHAAHLGFRARIEVIRYAETVIGVVEEKNPAFLGIDAYWRF